IHCSCQKCDNNRCIYKKRSIRCGRFCKNCERQTCKNPSLRPSQDLLDDDSEDDYENKIEDLGDCNAENVELQLQEESIAEINNESLRSS
ncbi:hypothetical protein M0802_012141, partial [Mischocyttarus mexicanus]